MDSRDIIILPGRQALKLSRLIFLVTLLGIFSMATHFAIDSDTWWHLRAGQWMVENRKLIEVDSFSYTSVGAPWQYPGLWLQVLMFLLFDRFGAGGLNLWVSIMVACIFGVIWKTTTGNELVRALTLFLAAAASAIYWAARPYLVTYLLAALTYYFLEKYYRDERDHLWWLPLIMIVWVNSHGGFLSGFLFWASFLADSVVNLLVSKRMQSEENIRTYLRKSKRIFLIGFLMLVVTFINPHGLTLWELPFTTVSRQAEQLFIAEWQSPNFHESTMLPFAILLILTIGAVGGGSKRMSLVEFLLVGGFALLGLISIRNIFFFVIIAPSIITRFSSPLFHEWGEKLRFYLNLDFSKPPTKIQGLLNIAMVLLVGAVALGRLLIYLPDETNQAEIISQFPVNAVNIIRESKPEGRLFNAYNFGGYIIWALPEYPVFVDGRADLHQDEIILEWYQVMNAVEGWEEVFYHWDVGVVMIEPGVPLVNNLIDRDWKLEYSDELAIVFTRPDNLDTND